MLRCRNKKKFHQILLSIIMMPVFCTEAKESKLIGWYKTLYSGGTFHITLLYNRIKHGSGCTFHRITDGGDTSATVTISKDSSGTITAIDDGKKTPLVLGSIPCTQKHLDHVRSVFNLDASDVIELFSLNRTFERNWAGLSQLVDKSNGAIRLYKYPTTDNTAPHLTDILRAVRDLRTRDERGIGVAYVHCKAGRGRSAVVVAAYLIAVLDDANIAVSIREIERYLKRCRSQVKLGKPQRKVLAAFKNALQDAGDFEHLCALYQDEITQRDHQVYSEK